MPGAPQRDWIELKGAVNDVEMLKQMLVLLYGVDPAQIVALTDQAATRAAILQSLEHLVTTSRKGDVVLFYFGGHGSQQRNSQSDERDKLASRVSRQQHASFFEQLACRRQQVDLVRGDQRAAGLAE